MPELNSLRIGWIGVGNMGRPLVSRLLRAGCDVAVYNRTRAKAEPLAEIGATLVDRPVELADRDLVFVVVSGPDDVRAVTTGPNGLLTDPERAPRLVVDHSPISPDAAREVRLAAEARGSTLLAAPVSGNGDTVAKGAALFAVSGTPEGFEQVRPYLDLLGRGVHYLGEGEAARVAKIGHNLYLGAQIQSLVETTLLAQSAGLDRRAYLDFLNDSALGSTFSRYKSPALIGLDWTPTFTSGLLRKDLDLGLSLAAERELELPVTAAARVETQATIDAGYETEDFAVMLVVQAERAGIELTVEEEELSPSIPG